MRASMIRGMSDQQNKPGVAFWSTVAVVVLLVAYPLSFGPACWISSQSGVGLRLLPKAYSPMIWIMAGTMDPDVGRTVDRPCRAYLYPSRAGLIERYTRLLAQDGWRWRCGADFGGRFGQVEQLTEDEWEWGDSSK